MGNLAIKGHATRGKEVIEILEMLGGINEVEYCGDLDLAYYFINDNYIDWCYEFIPDNDFICFTLEEFLEKYPYKVGDKVYNIIHKENQTITNLVWHEDEVIYQTNNNEYVYVNYLQPYKEEAMEEINIDRIGFNGDKAKLILPNGYEFKTEGKEVYIVKKQPYEEETNMKESTKLNLSAIDYNNGLVGYEIPEGYEFDTVIDNKVVIKKLKPQYPKTYEECCEVLGKTKAYQSVSGYKTELLEDFQKLLICRDAYWKIAGEQMGLGKPWKPEYVEGVVNTYYTIHLFNNKLFLAGTSHRNAILSFPTAEMRDAFYENFKELIEQCKELL